MGEQSRALGCGIIFLLLVGLGATYGLWSFHQECRNGVPRILSEREAVRYASRFLLEKMTPGQLSLASDKPALAAYLKHNPKCCSAESEFDPRYWDYLWTVKFYLRGYVNDQPREEYAIISVSACGYYDEMNWTSDYYQNIGGDGMDSAKTDKYGIGIKMGDGKIWNMFDFQNHYLSGVGSPVIIDMNWYMTAGAGRYVNPSQFGIIQKITESKDLQPGKTYDILSLVESKNDFYWPRRSRAPVVDEVSSLVVGGLDPPIRVFFS